MTDVLPYPPFRYPEDWRPSNESLHHAAAPEHIEDATLDHDTKHAHRAHPWCLRCEVEFTLPDPHRLARARAQLGDVDDWADVISDLDDIFLARTPDPVDLEQLATSYAIDAADVRDVLEYLYALDEVDHAKAERIAVDRGTPEGYAAALDVVCMSRVTRYLRKHDRRAPADNYDPDTDDGTAVDGYSGQVAAEALRLQVREDAKALHEQRRAQRNPADPFDAGLLSEILARPAEPAHRVDGLIPSDGATLVVAQRKTGKTTFNLNLTQALLTGDDFLDRFAVRPITGRVSILNFEVAGAQLGRWAADVGIDPDRLHLVNLRGRRNPLTHPADRAALAQLLRGLDVETLIVDPFGRAYTGQSQNDAGEVGAWLTDLDAFARAEVGAHDLILNAHAGWDGERTRGASALEDWADSIITLTKGTGDDTGRYMRALGRDVDVDEDGLTFNPTTRTLTMAGTGSRRTKTSTDRSALLISAVHGVVTANPGVTVAMISNIIRRQGVKFQRGDESKALAAAVEQGLMHVVTGDRGAKHHYPGEAPRPTPTTPAGASGTHPTLPLYGEGGSQGVNTNDPPQAIASERGDAA